MRGFWLEERAYGANFKKKLNKFLDLELVAGWIPDRKLAIESIEFFNFVSVEIC